MRAKRHTPARTKTRWRGHQETTSLVLGALLNRCATEGAPRISRPERVLFTACEFWAAAMNRTVRRYLGTRQQADARLRAAEESYIEIGAPRAATILRLERIDLAKAGPAIPVREVATAIEKGLIRTEDPVDDLIAQFAIRQTWDRC